MMEHTAETETAITRRVRFCSVTGGLEGVWRTYFCFVTLGGLLFLLTVVLCFTVVLIGVVGVSGGELGIKGRRGVAERSSNHGGRGWCGVEGRDPRVLQW